jgi:hypothetical protein
MNKNRYTFVAKFVGCGLREKYRHHLDTTYIFEDVRSIGTEDRIFIERIEFQASKWNNELNLECGNKIQFDASVKKFISGIKIDLKGVKHPVIDMKLSYVKNAKKITKKVKPKKF